MRLSKVLAFRLGVSRREADDMIVAGRVKEGGKVAVLGQRVAESDEIVCDDEKVEPREKMLYVVMNKPAGYVSSRRQQSDAPTLYELLPEKYQRLKTVGRLDRESSGLIMLTDDGDFAFRMTHPRFTKTKIYEVKLRTALEPLHQQMIGEMGVSLADGKSRLGLMSMSDDRRVWQVTMSEGRNRQIRRTFAALGYEVVKLHRVSFGNYALDGLEEGKFRFVERD